MKIEERIAIVLKQDNEHLVRMWIYGWIRAGKIDIREFEMIIEALERKAVEFEMSMIGY